MNILYIGYYTSDALLHEIQERKINNMSIARQKFEENLLSGLIEELRDCDNLFLVSYVPVDNHLHIPDYSLISNKKVKHIPINRKKIQSWISAKKTFSRYLKSLNISSLNDLTVLMYEVNPIFLSPLLSLKRKHKFNLVSICAELSSLRRSKKIIYQIRNKVFACYEKKFDGYILFADKMKHALRCENKPHIVIEGISPDIFGVPSIKKKNIIMYAGGLGKDNNIKMLIDCCLSLDEVDELWICGTGKDKELVIEASRTYPKIVYFGVISNERVRELEKKAKLLINLREPSCLITQYSFPSKILEYLASGTLVASTKLEGIPEEYFQHMLIINTTQKEDITLTIKQALEMNEKEYIKRTTEAQLFISQCKNKNVQTKKLLTFLKNF